MRLLGSAYLIDGGRGLYSVAGSATEFCDFVSHYLGDTSWESVKLSQTGPVRYRSERTGQECTAYRVREENAL